MMILEDLNLWGCRWEWSVSVWIKISRCQSAANCHLVFSTETWLLRAQGWWSSVSILTSHIEILLPWAGETIEHHIIVKQYTSMYFLLEILDTCACGSLTWLGVQESWLCQEGPWCFYLVKRTEMEWQLSYMMDRWGEREANDPD